MLKLTGIKLEITSDVDMHLFIEKRMRGGISCISKRHIKFNGDNKFIMYWDANNLYGWAMNQPLPYCDFNFLTKKEISEFCLNSISENSPIGYILEADLEYCKKLHDSHSDYPLVPEKLTISSDILSKYCSNIYGIKVGGVGKLVPNLRDEIKNIVYYKNLQYYLPLGMKLIKVHRILKFKRSNWLKEYIEFNTEKRKNAVSEFEKGFFKLLINCIFGKSMENIRKRISVKLINNSKDSLRCVSKPNFISQNLFDKTFIAVHQIKSVLTLNKPIYVEFNTLKLSKLLMYKFHYDYACNKYDAKLLFTDTDSLVYEMNSEDIYKQCFKGRELFDFSGYPIDSKYYDSTNKKVLGKMKDEFNRVKIIEFVGLKSKMYSLISVDDRELNKAKGINKKLRHQEHVDVLLNKKVVRHNMKRIQSKLHEIGTYDVFKISLNCFDDKRYVLDDGINTLAYFHKDIKTL